MSPSRIKKSKGFEQRYISVSELAARWSVSASGIYSRKCGTSALTPIRLGRAVRFLRAEVEALERKEQRSGGEFWGYDVWIRQPDGSRKRFREFSFATKAEADQDLAALKTVGWKARYGLKSPSLAQHTSINDAIASYLKVTKANLLANKTDDSTYWRDAPGHLRTLQRWGEFVGLSRHVSSIRYDDFVFWVAAETERGGKKKNGNGLKKATIRRGLRPSPNRNPTPSRNRLCAA